MLEGMAELGQLEFEARHKIRMFYNKYHGSVLNADIASKTQFSHDIAGPYQIKYSSLTDGLGKNTWRYADVASFFCYIHENYGMDKTLEMYSSNGDTAVMEEQFGKTFPELIADWREYLWEGDIEPDDWWNSAVYKP